MLYFDLFKSSITKFFHKKTFEKGHKICQKVIISTGTKVI